jgi:hypothetical protein
MNKKTKQELLFFILIFLLFFLFVKLGLFWGKKYNNSLSYNNIWVITSVLFTCVIVVVFFIAKLNKNEAEGFWDVSEYAKCRGGSYMHQGDSEQAKKCRELAETPEGRCGIASYNCSKGYNGIPLAPFVYTPLSNDKWQNERCSESKDCGCPSAFNTENGDSLDDCSNVKYVE